MEVYVLLGFVLILSIYLGLELISKVPSTLHTPLMSGANAISGIALVGALVLSTNSQLQEILALLAITFASSEQLAIDGTLVGLPSLHTGRSTPARGRADHWVVAGLRASPQWGAAGSDHRSDDHRRLMRHKQRQRPA